MKKTMLSTFLLLAILAPLKSWAGVQDFNSMIVESMESKQELSKKLQKNIEAVNAANTEDQRVRETKQVFADVDLAPENIAVPSQHINEQIRRTDKKMASKLDKANLKRVSQEIEEGLE